MKQSWRIDTKALRYLHYNKIIKHSLYGEEYPFITNGYISAEYFCDRVAETGTLTRYITNGNNVALISSRRLGKTGLIEHCFHQKHIEKEYYIFLIDIYMRLRIFKSLFLSLAKEL